MPSKRLKDLLRLGLGSQSIKHPPLVPEYKDFIHLDEATPNPAYKLLAAPPQQGPNDTEQQEPEEAPKQKTEDKPSNTEFGTNLKSFCKRLLMRNIP